MASSRSRLMLGSVLLAAVILMATTPVAARLSHSGISLHPKESPSIYQTNRNHRLRPELQQPADPILISLTMPPLLGERRNDMAIRYVKDFEFPAAAGFTDSATKVTGQMYAKGGEAKAPKGKEMVLLIGVGMPKKPPMKKAEGSYVDQDDYMAQLEKKSPIQSGTYMDRMTGAAKKEYDKFYRKLKISTCLIITVKCLKLTRNYIT